MKLYKLDSLGKLRIWEVIKIGNLIVTRHGRADGAMQESEDEIRFGMQGRSVDEQVDFQINSMIKRRLDKGYVKDKNKAVSNPKNSLGFHKPMLASKVSYEKISYGNCYVQRKYDGHRCLITMHNGTAIAYSRGGKLITSINHILHEIQATGRLEEGETLDGELYIHGIPLQEISSLVRTQKAQSPSLIFHCYDFISGESFPIRLNKIQEKLERLKYSRAVETFHAMDKLSILDYFGDFREEGYEGAIVRWGQSGYQDGKRVKHLMKVKEVIRNEFKVLDIITSYEGFARLVCNSKGGKFRVLAHGTHLRKREILVNKEKYIGKYITVEFACYTNSGKPSQPVAVEWRDKDEFK